MNLFSTVALLALAAAPVAHDPRSEQALVDEVRAVDVLADHRQTHVNPPLEGTFESLATPHFERLFALSEHHLSGEGLKAYEEGTAGWDSVPADVRERVERAEPDVLGLLEATHAASGRLAPYFTAFMPLDGKSLPEESLLFAMHAATTLARRSIEAHDGKALQLCIDGLAVGRDLSYGNAIGRMLGSSTILLMARSCFDALRAAPPTPTRCAELQSVAAHTAPLSVMVEQEKVFAELAGFGRTLDRETLAQLPTAALELVNHPEFELELGKPVRFAKLRGWLFGSWARRDYVSAMNDLIAAADGPPASADPSFANFDQLDNSWSHTLMGTNGLSSHWLNFARRWREAQTYLNAIAATCTMLSTKSGTGWPPIPAAIDARTGAPLRLEVQPDGTASLVADSDPTRDAKRLEFPLAR